MPLYEVEHGGKTYEVDAPDPQTAASAFDSTPPARKMGMAEGSYRAVQKGLTLGWDDEISAGLNAVGSKLTGDPRPIGALYDAYRSQTNAENQRFRSENPNIAAFAEGTGSALTAVPAMVATGGAAAPATLPTVMARGAATGAAYGYGAGAGNAEAGQRMAGGNEGATVGAVLGAGLPLLPYAAKGVQAAGRRVGEGVSHLTDLVRPIGPRRLAERTLQDLVADPQRRELISALTADRGFPTGFNPTSAQQAQGTPAATLIQSLEASAARQPGGRAAGNNPSAMFANRDAEQAAALQAAKAERDALTGKMRETTLRLANDTTSRIQELGTKVRDRFLSKANALQQKGQFDTEASIQARLADQRPAPGGGPVTDALGIGGREAPGMAAQGAGMAPRPPGRYTPNAERSAENAAASTEMPAIVRQRQAELEMAERELKQLQDQGADPLTIKGVQDKIAGIMRTPGMRASSVVQKAMDSVTKRLQGIVQADGTVNAHDLYMIRKELGNEIDVAMKESSSFDKKLAGTLRNEVQDAMDTAIESALPSEARGSWREYLKAYADRSQKIDNAVTAAENAYKPARPTDVGSAEAGQVGVDLPATLSRPGLLARSILKIAGRDVTPKVDVQLAEILLDPAKAAQTLANTKNKSALIDALTMARRTQPFAAGIAARQE